MIKKIITTTTLIAAAAAMANAADASLVYYNSFDNVDGDLSSLGNELGTGSAAWTATNQPTASYHTSLEEGLFGGALYSNDGNSIKLVTTDTSLTAANGFSVSFHVKLGADVTSGYPVLFSIGTDSGQNVKINLDSSDMVKIANEGSTYVAGGTREGDALSTTDWTHVVLTGEKDGSNNKMIWGLYVNGTKNTTAYTSSAAFTSAIDMMSLGGRLYNNDGTPRADAYFDDLAVYSGVLTGAQVTSLMNAAAIPEPSMFGLLAGLGALALVGARRRRK